MTKITLAADCGNSPKNLFVKDLTIALARRQAPFILGRVSDDVVWNRVGQNQVMGRQDLAQALKQLKSDPVAELTVVHVLTHGRAGAVDGRLRLGSGQSFAFCDVYEFENAKAERISQITSYLIALG